MAECTSADSDRCSTHRKYWPWPGVLFVLFGVQMTIVAASVALALSDRSFAIEPDYYRKALHWDDQVAQVRANRSLGWRLTLDVASEETPAGRRRVTVSLLDREGRPLEGAKIQMTVFHHARAAERTTMNLSAAGEGRYAADVRLRRAGLWEFRFVAQLGADVFTAAEYRDVAVSAGASP